MDFNNITLKHIINASNAELYKLSKITTNPVIMKHVLAGALIHYKQLLSYRNHDVKQKKLHTLSNTLKKKPTFWTWLIKYGHYTIGYIALYPHKMDVYRAITFIEFIKLIDPVAPQILKDRNYYALRIVIDHEYHGKGIGTYVISLVINIIKKHNVNIISLIETSNEASIKIHLKNKFYSIGTLNYKKTLYYVFLHRPQLNVRDSHKSTGMTHTYQHYALDIIKKNMESDENIHK
jgi:GNAT superfamily N-acetyltransferase